MARLYSPYNPKDYTRIKIVDDIQALLPYFEDDHVNLRVFQRSLTPDFNALARRLVEENTAGLKIDVREMNYYRSRLEPAFAPAMEQIAKDMQAVAGAHNDVTLRVLTASGYANTNIHHYHADGGDFYSGRVLCAYNDPVTEILKNEDARRLPEFENRFDSTGGAPFAFSAGDIWQIAVMGGKPPPVIHRAPRTDGDAPPRLVMVAGYNTNRSR